MRARFRPSSAIKQFLSPPGAGAINLGILMNQDGSAVGRFYAHTAEDGQGRRLPSEHWQLLRDHLRQVAELAKGFARPLGLEAEAELAGLLHDLGKYAKRFQDRLHNNSIHGINHWAAGSVHAGETLKQLAVSFAVDGHHTGIPALDGNESFETHRQAQSRPEGLAGMHRLC
jgi:hypothetical protein